MTKRRKVTLIDLGDLTAPKGSIPWLIAVKEEARSALRDAKAAREHAQDWLRGLRDEERYRLLEDAEGYHFMTWDAFCSAPVPYGFGMPAAEIDAIIAAKPSVRDLEEEQRRVQAMAADPSTAELNGHGGDRKSGEKDQGSDRTLIRGETASYLIRRLKRDAPQIAAALGRGEYRSARAAAIAAGIVKVPTPMQQVQKLCRKLTKGERLALRHLLDTLDDEN